MNLELWLSAVSAVWMIFGVAAAMYSENVTDPIVVAKMRFAAIGMLLLAIFFK